MVEARSVAPTVNTLAFGVCISPPMDKTLSSGGAAVLVLLAAGLGTDAPLAGPSLADGR